MCCSKLPRRSQIPMRDDFNGRGAGRLRPAADHPEGRISRLDSHRVSRPGAATGKIFQYSPALMRVTLYSRTVLLLVLKIVIGSTAPNGAGTSRGDPFGRCDCVAACVDALRYRAGSRVTSDTISSSSRDLPGVGGNLQDHVAAGVKWSSQSSVPYGISLRALPSIAWGVD